MKLDEIALAVWEMYRSNDIPIEVIKEVTVEKSPKVLVMSNRTGITIKLGILCKKNTITKVVPKEEIDNEM